MVMSQWEEIAIMNSITSSLRKFSIQSFNRLKLLGMQKTNKDALKTLKESGRLFLEIFKHGTLSAGIYKPEERDYQQPHDKDEVYIIISGTGDFYFAGKTCRFQAGDFLFVPAGAEHRFENFSPGFSTWVIFYGPIGGEAAA
jgi:mannose-6-phosphate isomerase-like protein (cupin superfamily)